MSRRAKAQGNGDPTQEKTSDPRRQRRAPEDVAIASRETEDKTALKTSHVAPRALSDSENEEPVPGRTVHRSAFVSKNNASSVTSSWSLQSRLERSQSCSEHVNESLLVPGRRRVPQPRKAKVVPGVGGFAGVLLSTENSRSFSAPVLTSEKRVMINSLNAFAPLHKPERSVSPDSNDSISEELNHFKPIVCSPCTPPKRLPDGQVLSPLVIKSTPRNLRRNLQKPTTYEASPVILKKWEQVFQDRQMKRTLSKGTLTAPPQEGVRAPAKSKAKPNSAAGDLELLPSSSTEEPLETGSDGRPQPLPCRGCLQGKGPHSEPVTVKDFLDSHPGTKTRLAARLTSSKKTIPQCKCLVAKPINRAPKKKNAQPMGLPNGSAGNISPGYTQRRGQKRRCKTKHLEKNGNFKRLRVTCRAGGQGGFERLWRETEKKLRQEEEDKKLALKLQQRFDKERRRGKRKSSRDEYPLRSKTAAGTS
ncbi:E3 ubiquitin-protein ligase RNF169 [Rhinoderma darwinii]|uniref:E3 ubiquitin-protein ligase RNF169 n=1 Tax=Rhinoderma darwinii TaxID=43563 RepID=UPI003F671D2D